MYIQNTCNSLYTVAGLQNLPGLSTPQNWVKAWLLWNKHKGKTFVISYLLFYAMFTALTVFAALAYATCGPTLIATAHQPAKVISGHNKIHPITGKSLTHCSWHTSLYVGRGLGEMELNNQERQNLETDFSAVCRSIEWCKCDNVQRKRSNITLTTSILLLLKHREKVVLTSESL